MLLGRIGKADIKHLTSVIVRAAGAAGVGVPLVSGNANINTDRLNRQRTRHIDNAVVLFSSDIARIPQCNNSILRCCCGGTSINLRSVKLQCCNNITTSNASDGIVAIHKAARQSCAIIRFGLIVCQNNQFLLIININNQITCVSIDLISSLRSCCRSILSNQVRMMVNKSIRSTVLESKSITLFYILDFLRSNAVAVHVEIVHSDLRRGVRNVLKGNYIAGKGKCQFL